MKRSLIIIFLSLVVITTPMAQGVRRKSPQTTHSAKSSRSIPTIEQILDKYVEAIGGEAANKKLITRVIKGTFEIPGAGVIGSIEYEAMAPNKLRTTLQGQTKNGARFELLTGFDGVIAWEFNLTSTSHRRPSDAELTAKSRNAEFYREIKLKELYPKMTLKGEQKVGGRAVYVIEATPAEGNSERWYFDVQTGLLVRLNETFFDDYREVDGVKLPFSLRTSSGAGPFIAKFDEIRHNVPIEEARFKDPDPALAAATTDEYIRTEMKKRRIPGLALVVIKNGEIAKMQGYGSANLEHDVPVTPDTVFELASVTKQFTATAIMKLVEEGKIMLDHPIMKYLPRSPRKWNGITVRHLLTHTAGLPGLHDGFASLPDKRDYTTAEMFKSATEDPISFAPGAKYQYSDVGYFLLGMIIEKASGQRYKDFLAERFFKPLGMTSTSVDDQWAVLKNRAAGYTIHDDQIVNIRRVAQVELPSHYGVFSTVRDLVKWDNALATGKVVKEFILLVMWTPVKLKNGSFYPYGFGWELGEEDGHRTIFHGGYTGTEYTRFPDDKLTVIVLTNLGLDRGDEPVDSWGLTNEVARRYLSGRP